jgi:hypothetical protein
MKMKKYLLLFGMIVILWGCTPNNDIMLDQNTSYQIPEEYKVVTTTQNDIEMYRSFFGNKEENFMVLYKLLSGSNHLIFIGIGYNTSFEKIKKEILLQSENKNILQKSIQNNSFTISFNRDSLTTITHYLRVLDSGNKYLFSVLNKGKTEDSTFIKQYIENQILIN